MGQFDWFSSIGATPQAVAVLNDQPILFTILLIVLVVLIAQGVLLWYIHKATLKPEQIKAKADAKKNGGGLKLPFGLSKPKAAVGGDNVRRGPGAAAPR